MAFKGTIEGVISFQKLWNNTLKQTSVVQGAIATGTKIYAAAQGVLNFVIGAGSTALKLFRLALISNRNWCNCGWYRCFNSQLW